MTRAKRCVHPFTKEINGRIICQCGADRTPRRHTVEGCAGCEPRGMRPSHDASGRCSSGGHPHCSCGGCFG